MFNTPAFKQAAHYYRHHHNVPSTYSHIESLYTFTDRETYLLWVQMWREQYKELSGQIRELKRELALPHGAYGRPKEQSIRQSYRDEAFTMLDIRRIAKAKSWQLKQQNKVTQA